MKKASAFTLIELMVTVAILGIIATIGIPQYQSYMMRAYRTDTITELQAILAAQERFYGDNITYTTNLLALGYTLNGAGQYSYSEDRYRISARNCDGMAINQCVELVAVARNEQARDGDLVVNTLGVENRIQNGQNFSFTD